MTAKYVIAILLFFMPVLLLPASFAHAAGAGITYHGRLMDPNGSAVVSSAVQFKVQLRTPGSENCLLYEEVQVKDLSATDGVFSVTINDTTGTRLDSSGYSLDQIFANRGSFTFASGQCASGTTYNTTPSDGRRIQILFNDGTFAPGTWEPVPAVAINFVPMAIEAMQVGGYKKEQLIKVADGVSTTGTELDSTAWSNLKALLAGTSTQYITPSSATFTSAPTWSGTPSTANDLANKAYVDAQVAAGLPNVGTAGTYTKVTTDAKGRVTSGTTLAESDLPNITTAGKVDGGALNAGTIGGSTAISTSGNLTTSATVTALTSSSTNLRVYNGANYVQFTAPALSGNVLFKVPSADGSAGQVLKTDGSGNWGWSSLDAGNISAGTLPVARGGTGATTFAANAVVVSNGTGSALQALNCTLGQVVTFDISGNAGCGTAPTGLPAPAGTAAAPGYAFSGNTNTGIYNPAANQIGIATNGTEQLRIDASGNVGVGTAAPAEKLEVNGAVKVGTTANACTSANKGAIRYNDGTSVLEFCNGSAWSLIQAAACTDATPNVFSFADEANATASSVYTSNVVQLNGINCSVPVTISGGGTPEFQICADSGCSSVVQGWTSSPSSITNNQYLQVRLTTDVAGGATMKATVIAGSGATVWTVTNAGGDCTASPTIGTVCADGTIYAGLSPDGNVKMFTTRCDAGQTWDGVSTCTGVRTALSYNNGTTNSTITGAVSSSSGQSDAAILVGLSDAGAPYASAQYCDTLSLNGKTDWYLPAIGELNLLSASQNAIRNFNPVGTYWSSSETGAGTAMYAIFSSQSQDTFYKKDSRYVRCVRK